MSTFSKLWIKLRDRAYRHAFAATQLKRGLPFQFQAMRKKLGLSQSDLAQLAGVSQGVISRAEDPNYGNLTFNTALRVAAGLDCAFVGRLVPFSDLANWFDDLSEHSVQVPTFAEEDETFKGLGTTFDIVKVSVPVDANVGRVSWPQPSTTVSEASLTISLGSSISENAIASAPVDSTEVKRNILQFQPKNVPPVPNLSVSPRRIEAHVDYEPREAING